MSNDQDRQKASGLDKAFDEDASVVSMLDMEKARRPGLEQRRMNVDFPAWMVRSIDREARRLGVSRQSLIKLWLADRLQHTYRSNSVEIGP